MTPPVGLRVVSFNIEHGNGGDADALGRACAGLEADVLALQEVDVRVPRSRMVHQVGVVARATGMHAVFGRTCRVGAVGRYGNALFSRAPMTDVACLTLPRLGRNEVRGVIVARVAGVTVVATHLSGSRTRAHCNWTTTAPSPRKLCRSSAPYATHYCDTTQGLSRASKSVRGSRPPRRHLPAAKSSTIWRATSSRYCTGGDFMK